MIKPDTLKTRKLPSGVAFRGLRRAPWGEQFGYELHEHDPKSDASSVYDDRTRVVVFRDGRFIEGEEAEYRVKDKSIRRTSNSARSTGTPDFWLIINMVAKELVNSEFSDVTFSRARDCVREAIESTKLAANESKEREAICESKLEEYEGFVERIEDDNAFVRLRGDNDVTLYGVHSAKELATKGIVEGQRFKCSTFEAGDSVRISLEPIPWEELDERQLLEIRERIDSEIGEVDDDF